MRGSSAGKWRARIASGAGGRRRARGGRRAAERKLAEVRRSEIKKAAQWAGAVWNKCAPCEAHDYLTLKQIKPHGLRILPEDLGEMNLAGIDDSKFLRIKSASGAPVVPMHDAR